MASQNASFPHGFAAFCIFCCYPLPLVGSGTARQYHVRMRLIGNILWLILGGLLLAASWAIIGLVLCVTIVGIPLGVQAFKMAGLTLTPVRQNRGVWRRCGIGAGQYRMVCVGWHMDGDWLHTCRPAELRHHHWYSVRHSIVQDGQISAMAVRLANPQLVITSDHFTQHRRPSTAVLHISIEELRSERTVTTAP